MNWVAANWYINHLKGHVSLVFVTDNENYVHTYSSETNTTSCKLTVLDLPGFLQMYYPTLTTAKLLFDSLDVSLRSIQSKDHNLPELSKSENPSESLDSYIMPSVPSVGHIYPEYLPESALAAGLRSGQFLKGILHVSRFRPTTEAMVALTDAVKHQPELKEALAARSEIMIHGLQHRNRAVDGDVVVVRLLPRVHWKTVSSDISAQENCAAEFVNDLSNMSGSKPNEDCFKSETISRSLPCGFVVGVISHNWRDYVCTYVPKSTENSLDSKSESGWIIVTPWDRRIPLIRLHTTQISKLTRERFIVRIDTWDSYSAYPSGHFVQTLGCIGDLETETQTILIEHNLVIRNFTDAQLSELAPLSVQRPWKVDLEEVKKRRDLRSPTISGNPDSEDILIFSIDPPGCQDVDDALSVQWLPPIVDEYGKEHKRLQLGVHIADVSYFVPSGSYIDSEARRRSTSIYLADRRYDMLPGLLSGDLCSLWSGRDRYAVSVLWEIDMDSFDISNIWYGRTVIHSSYKLTYELAQRIYDSVTADNISSNSCAVEEFIKNKSILLLVDIASNVRERRLAKGGLELESVEVSVQFANPETRTGKLEDLIPKEPLEMHNTVAELMIFANHWVARRCVEYYPDRACLRRHPPPRPEYFDELKRCIACRGFVLDTSSNLSLANSLKNASDPNDPEVNKVVRQLVTRTMTNALYFSTGSSNMTQDQFSHYGLALNLYTHFTSPIRRYADIIVHRLLLASLGDFRSLTTTQSELNSKNTELVTILENNTDGLFSSEELASICNHMNEQHWAAQQVQRSSLELFQALFFKDKAVDDPSRYTEGIICQLRGTNGFIAFVPRSIERVYSSERSDCGVLEIRNSKTNECQQYRMFDHVLLKINVSESVAHGLNIRLELVGLPKTNYSKGKLVTANITTENHSVCTPSLNTNLIKDVQDIDAERRQKREVSDLEHVDVSKRKHLIAQLHDRSSLYHRFHKLLRQSNEDEMETN
ncbi:ribonuclease II-related [Schistosoma mansoni]|uniref:ribonuclease II-related n=1 Tax=Schistosoma mansoni TaxID=6183 RepID=UPI00022DC8E6|nr:ribonuclease II-related [Schistosoma mansoni]|eukprot:XP_018647748.1 ribonuclease II-related [Schistosoma mansoni]